MGQLVPISAERASELASFRTLRRLDVRYDEALSNLSVLLRVGGADGSEAEIVFRGVRGLNLRLGYAEPFMHEVVVRSIREDQMEGLNYRVTSDLGELEFGFLCQEILAPAHGIL